ncbi:DNA-directed RNA polymerase ii subunit rpb9 [Anaeramoeba ignava]|uniref:DNA-directed RNA polymerase subunit n=1 Tax=Anaeramoeba ignava TaxID=1746090 RepID=A0A9Q0LLG3_ANAIG|nr:DNA-directed RNA polymerase ii subunit rpb9 [Anaeramoeba ignava]KAJ5074988.1 DNA-directed RNA polymerase ii subunit rpb9 [Anaeramoeba ignava]
MSGIKFCPECNNMLRPAEDRKEKKLRYVCDNCHHSEYSENARIYVNHIKTYQLEETDLHLDYGSDPTLPRTDRECDSCQQTEAVFFQVPNRKGEETMELEFRCVGCGKKLIHDHN